MRCYCCNVNLSNYESTLKHPDTGQYLDTCLQCLPDTGIIPITPKTIQPQHGWDEEDAELFIETGEYEDD